MEKKHVPLLLLLDFTTAFDSVCPVKSREKLGQVNFDSLAIKWEALHLTGREQVVLNENGVLSCFIPLNKRAPQGCVLSPRLLLLFMNDIA